MHRRWHAALAVGGVLMLGASRLSPSTHSDARPQIPGLDRILKRPPALTTSAADAVFVVPFLDDFDPQAFDPVDKLIVDDECKAVARAPELNLIGLNAVPNRSMTLQFPAACQYAEVTILHLTDAVETVGRDLAVDEVAGILIAADHAHVG